jgi:hypothetical protein
MASPAQALKSAGPAVLWLAGALFILESHRVEGTHYHGRHHAADPPALVALVLAVMAIETAVLYAVLRPWSYRGSTRRILLAWAIFVPWTLVSWFGIMHSGSSILAHAIWLVLVNVVLLVSGMISAGTRRHHPAAIKQ